MKPPLSQRLLAIFRAIRLVLHLAYGALLAIIYPSLQINLQKRIMQKWSAELLCILHVRVSVSGKIPMREITQGLVVANHISWLDVFVMSSVLPMRFVAKSEVRGWPVIGWLCARAQTIFIERNKRSDTLRANRQAIESLQQGSCMAIFPEGTTTDGLQVKHFHASLFQPAIDAQTLIYPIAVRYHDKDNNPNFDAAYIDEMSFGDSLWNILTSRDLHARLTTTEALPPHTENRRILAVQARHCVARALSIELPASAGDQTTPHKTEDDSPPFQSPYSLLLYPSIKSK